MPGLVIEREVVIEAPAEVVWRTITEPDQMSQWFADRVELVIEPGAHGYMGFGDQSSAMPTSTRKAGPSTWTAWPRCSRRANRDDRASR